jgi:hypothetical protein
VNGRPDDLLPSGDEVTMRATPFRTPVIHGQLRRSWVVLLLLADPAVGIAAQSSPGSERFMFDVGAGLLMSVPAQFESNGCGPFVAVDARAGLAVLLTETLSTESSFSASASPASCEALEALAPPTNGDTTHRVYDDGIAGEPIYSVAQRVVYDARPHGSLSPRGFAGGGWFVGKGIGFWSAGAGLRLGGRTSPWIIEVERTTFELGFVERTRVWQDGELIEVSDSPSLPHPESMWAVRLRIPFPG